MKSDIILVSSRGAGMEAAFEEVDKVSVYKQLSHKNNLYLHLLAEEMMALVRAIAGEVSGEFWIEDEKNVFELHLKVRALMNSSTREKLISTSTSGKNEAARGFMGKLRSFFEYAEGDPVFEDGLLFGCEAPAFDNMVWSMKDYREQLRQYREENRKGAQEAWDELEKSVVSKVADNVKVSIKGSEAELTIIKRMA